MPGNDANTKLLLHMTGADTSTSFPDTSIGSAAHTVTANGDAQVDTAIKKWGTGSLLLDGTGDYLSIPDSADWDITGSYTLDFQVAHADHVGTETYIAQYEDATNLWKLYHINGSGIKFSILGAAPVDTDFKGEITDTNFHHLAMIKVGDYYGVYKDGNQIGFAWQSATDTFTGSVYIGESGAAADYFAGNMDEIRVQADNYFSAAPNSFPAAPLLLYGEGTDGDTTMANDGYSGAVTLTNATLEDDNPHLNATTSMYFNGTTAYATVVDTSGTDYDVLSSATDSWTIDLFVKHITHSDPDVYIAQYVDLDNRWFLSHQSGTGIAFYSVDATVAEIILDGQEISDTNWHHVAVVKAGSDFGIYLDGVQGGYVSSTSTNNLTAGLTIGDRGDGGAPFYGYMEQVQITKGNKFGVIPNVGLTSTITVPTAILTQDTITVPTEEYAAAAATTARSQAVIIA